MMARRADTLAAIGNELPVGLGGAHPNGSEAERVVSFLRGEVRARYTMTAERTIFDRVLHSLGLAEAVPDAPPPAEDAITLFA